LFKDVHIQPSVLSPGRRRSEGVDYGHLLFKRAYLITDSSLEGSAGHYAGLVQGWKRHKVGPLTVYAHPDLDVNSHGSEGLTIVLLGFAVDPLNGSCDSGEIVENLRSRWLKTTEGFFEYLDTLNGRFVLLVHSARRAFVLHDAMGTKTVFYDAESENTVISSHAALVADIQGYEMSPDAREFVSSPEYGRQNSYFPGVATPYSAVKMLTANTLLDIRDRKVHRYFPRAPLETRRITDGLVEEIARLFSSQIDLLSRDHRLAVSLSGGFDSRTTMAASRDHREDILYFTYGGLQKYEDDALLAAELCRKFDLEHMVIRKEDCGEGLEEFLAVWRVNTAFMRSDADGAIAKAIYESRLRDALHLKSNGSEITRVWYRWGMKHMLPNDIAPDTYAALYNIRPRSPFVVDAFRRYVETVEFRKEALFGYDVYDLLYWEHRVSAWHALQILDTDAAYDNFNIFNNRHILKLLLSVPFGDRLRGRLQYRVLESLSPEALEVPFYKDLKPRYVTAAKTLAKHAKYYVDRALPL